MSAKRGVSRESEETEIISRKPVQITRKRAGSQDREVHHDDEYTSEGSNASDDDFDYYQEEDEVPDLETFERAPEPAWKEAKRMQGPSWLRAYKLKPGPRNHNLSSDSAPLDFFSLILTPETIEDLRTWTNKRGSSRIDNRKRRLSHMKKWHSMDVSEMKAFVGCLIVMGIVRQPGIHCYWEKDSSLFSCTGITDIFSRQRFIDIYSNLCLRDPSSNPISTSDRLYKILPFVTSIITQSQKHYVPEQEVSIDESMVPFHRRNRLIQYMPLKPVKYGLKAFLLSEARTGYVLKWKLYTGDPDDIDADYGQHIESFGSYASTLEEKIILYLWTGTIPVYKYLQI